ncbi:MAG: hypothetical protein ACLFPE_15275 [Bacteroidales bacterium]
MSGPKRYAVKVFDEHLKEVFSLQGHIETLWDLLAACDIRDESGRTVFYPAGWMEQNRGEYQQLSGILLKDDRDELTQQQFDDFYNRMFIALERLSGFRRKLEKQLSEYRKVDRGWQQYQEVRAEYQRMRAEFNRMKSGLAAYLRKNLPEELKLTEILKLLDQQEFSCELPPFDPDAECNAEALHKMLKQEFDQAVQRMNMEVHGHQPAEIRSQKMEVSLVKALSEENPSQIAETLKNIRQSLQELKDANTRRLFEQRLAKYLSEQKEKYLFDELLSEAAQAITTEKLRDRIDAVHQKLAGTEIEKELQSTAQAIMGKIRKLSAGRMIRKNVVDDLEAALGNLESKNATQRSLRLAVEAEQRFIRMRLVSELRKQNYEVLTDMQVVDFSVPDDLLLEIPGQQNYLNIRFDKDHKLLYNFLIPENRRELSHEKMQQRLDEMEHSCGEFKKMLAKLKEQGLDIEPEHETPVAEQYLISLPPKYEEIKKSSHRKAMSRKRNRKYPDG